MTVHCPFVQLLAVHFGFKGGRSTVVAFDIKNEHVVKLVKSCAKLSGDIDGQEVFRIEAGAAGMNVFVWRLFLSSRRQSSHRFLISVWWTETELDLTKVSVAFQYFWLIREVWNTNLLATLYTI